MFPKPEAELNILLNELTACLHEKRWFLTRSPAPDILNRIAHIGSPAALPWLLPLVHSDNENIRAAAERAVAVLLPKLRPHQIVELECLIRESWALFHSADHSYRAETEFGARLASLDSSGWNREKAITALIRVGDVEALPFMLLRLNDWVTQVRKAAEKWFAVHGDSIQLSQLVGCLPILAVLSERSYGSTSSIVKLLLTRLTTSGASAVLLEVLPHTTARVRRLAFTLLAPSGALHDPALQAELLRHSEPMLGILLLKHLRVESPDLPSELLNQALMSRSATLRRYALYCLSENQIRRLTPLLSQAIFDSAQGVRNFAQYHLLKQVSAEELQSRYSLAMQNARTSNTLQAACIMGFHEVGGRWSTSRYLELASHPSMRVRVAVLRVFSASHFEASLPWLKTAIESNDAPALSKAALAVLRRHPQSLTLDEVKALLAAKNSDIVRWRAFSLLCLRGKWEQLPVLLDLLHEAPDFFNRRVLSHLSSWLSRFNRSQIQPTRAQVEQSLTALKSARIQLGPKFGTEFHALLHSLVSR